MSFEDLLGRPPYASSEDEKATAFPSALREAFDFHYGACEPYRKFCDRRGFRAPLGEFELERLPYLPVEIFKQMRLSSVDDAQIVRTLQSSATSSQTPSTVVIDHLTRMRQVKTLVWILADFIGKDRRPFVIMDADPARIPPGQGTISARAAAIRGFLTAASSATYCMTADDAGAMSVDLEALSRALDAASGRRVVILGYTYVLYSFAARELQQAGRRFSLPDAMVLHIGGWKKLQSEAVSKVAFNRALSETFGMPETGVVDVYGFTEQLGLVYPDCEQGFKHCSMASEVIVRDPNTLEPSVDGEEGLLEFLSPLPHSYPGIAILLDDLGRVRGRGRCGCGRHGTRFEVVGRAKQAEVRGCGDILSEKVARPR